MNIQGCAAPADARGGLAMRRGQCGFSLVEVMIALVVLAVGLLALASLQTRALSGSSGSYQRTQAVLAGNDIIDRIRANSVNVANYAVGFGAPPAGATVAALDLQQWKAALAALPLGDGSVVVNGQEITVIVQWDDDRSGTVVAGEQLQTDTRL